MSDLRAYLAGSWSLERVTLDRATGTRGSFTGTVTFTALADEGLADDGALLQSEHGTMRWGPHTAPASREYVWRPGPRPSTMEVFFSDGRPFHTVDLAAADPAAADPSGANGPGAFAAHWCAPDDYRVHYWAIGPDELRYTWDVTGPAKDLLLESVLRRA